MTVPVYVLYYQSKLIEKMRNMRVDMTTQGIRIFTPGDNLSVQIVV